MKTRVLLVDDHEVLLEGLSALLDKEAGVEIAGRAGNGEEAIERAFELEPDVIIMDLMLPGMNGIEATRQIRERLPNTKILCLSMHADKRFVSAAFDAGASGYVLKEEPLSTVIDGLRAVRAGHTYVCEGVSGVVVKAYLSAKGGDPGPPAGRLSNREREVLKHFAEGKSTRDIANLLHLSPKTIASHRDNIKEKLGISSIAGLTKYAIRHGLTTAEHNP
ncbi:MAG: response regulator transcription factor [Acidobacteriota bacterium]|nr:response regulator transcription factor [Acidobacteriota bacterium]